MAKRSAGSGSLFQRGNTWWIAYRHHGKLFRESAETTVKEKAKNLLKDRITGLHTGTFDPSARNTTVADLYSLLENDYAINNKSSIEEVKRNWKNHLEPFFGHMKASDVNYGVIAKYVEHRQSQKASNGTCNRELSNLKRMFRLGEMAGKVNRKPIFPQRLKESAPRSGFVEADQHAKLAEETAKYGLWLRGIFEVGFTFGWRKEEVLGLRVGQVDFKNRSVRLHAGTTKNGDGRVAIMTQPLFELLKLCCEGKKANDAVFTREDGEPVLDFRGAWDTACESAGCEGLLFHDLRRTAVRNLVRAGVPEGVAMKISGHKTRSIFERYNIVSEKDIADAASKLEAFHACSQFVHNEAKMVEQHQATESTKSLAVN